TFNGNAGATQTDRVTVTAVATDSSGATTSASATATLTITDVPPQLTVTNRADPQSRPVPGGIFTHTVTVTNAGAEPVTIASLADDVYGDLTTRSDTTCASAKGTVLQPGATYTCSFTATFTGVAGASSTDTVRVTATDDDGT